MYQLINTFASHLYMGGYGSFVWSSYAAVLVIFLINLVLPIRQFRRIKARLRSKI